MKLLIIPIIFLISLPTWACWHLKGDIDINGKKVEINQKINHDKSYSFQNGEFIVHIKLPSKFKIPDETKNKKNAQLIQAEIVQKKGITLKTLSKPQILVLIGNEATMTIEDSKTKDFTKITVKLEHI